MRGLSAREDSSMLIHVWGEYGLYTRPEFASDRVSYPVPPLSTITGLLEAFFWKRGVVWLVQRVYVLSEVRHVQIMRNERLVDADCARTQRRALFVKAPSYVVDARPASAEPEQEGKALAMTERWLLQGRSRRPLFLGSRECLAYLGPPPDDYAERAAAVNRDMPPLGRMPSAILYDERGTPLGTEWTEHLWDRDSGSYGFAGGPRRPRRVATPEFAPPAVGEADAGEVWVGAPSSRAVRR